MIFHFGGGSGGCCVSNGTNGGGGGGGGGSFERVVGGWGGIQLLFGWFEFALGILGLGCWVGWGCWVVRVGGYVFEQLN